LFFTAKNKVVCNVINEKIDEKITSTFISGQFKKIRFNQFVCFLQPKIRSFITLSTKTSTKKSKINNGSIFAMCYFLLGKLKKGSSCPGCCLIILLSQIWMKKLKLKLRLFSPSFFPKIVFMGDFFT